MNFLGVSNQYHTVWPGSRPQPPRRAPAGHFDTPNNEKRVHKSIYLLKTRVHAELYGITRDTYNFFFIYSENSHMKYDKSSHGMLKH